MLAQLMPVSGGFASSQLVSSNDEPIAISDVARQPERAAERQPVLMPVQLPDDLVVAARRIEIGHPRPEAARARGAAWTGSRCQSMAVAWRSAEREAGDSQAGRTGLRRCCRRVRARRHGASGKRSRIAGDQRPAVRRRRTGTVEDPMRSGARGGDGREATGRRASTREPRRATDPPPAHQEARCDSRRAPNAHARIRSHAILADARLRQPSSPTHPRKAGQHVHGEPSAATSGCRRRFAQHLAVVRQPLVAHARPRVRLAGRMGVARQVAGHRRMLEESARSDRPARGDRRAAPAGHASPSVRIAGTPPAFVATTGRPLANASRIDVGMLSMFGLCT